MKRIHLFFLFLMSLFPLTLCAQTEYIQANRDLPWLRCHYLYQYASLESDLMRPEGLRFRRVVLDIGKQSSFFYFRTGYLAQLYCDSLQRIGFSWREASDKAIIRFGYKGDYADKVYKNYPQKGELRYIEPLGKTFYYDEILEKPQWEMLSGKKQIEGYACQQAICSFRGRNWTAWYTTAIPISDGPWKLWGLPGLILEAYDADNYYHFTFRGIEQINEEEPIQLIRRDWIKTTRKHFKELQELEKKDVHAFSRQVFGTDFMTIGKDGKVVKDDKPDYRPIYIEK